MRCSCLSLLSMRTSLRAIFLTAGSSSVSRNFLIATTWHNTELGGCHNMINSFDMRNEALHNETVRSHSCFQVSRGSFKVEFECIPDQTVCVCIWWPLHMTPLLWCPSCHICPSCSYCMALKFNQLRTKPFWFFWTQSMLISVTKYRIYIRFESVTYLKLLIQQPLLMSSAFNWSCLVNDLSHNVVWLSHYYLRKHWNIESWRMYHSNDSNGNEN